MPTTKTLFDPREPYAVRFDRRVILATARGMAASWSCCSPPVTLASRDSRQEIELPSKTISWVRWRH